MSQPFVGQIMMFAGNFPPSGWAICSGQLMPISENETLFNLIGTTYGGDGQSTFGLPDLQGRVAIHQGQGSGLSNYVIGQKAGTETVTLNVNQIPQHNHFVATVTSPGNQSVPASNTILADENSTAQGGGNAFTYLPPGGAQVALPNASIGATGGNQPHNNIQPVMAITYCISLFGIFPSPN
jgi:microcystin-dependent protein